MDRLLKATNMNKNQLLDIAKEFGTPLYVYDASVIKKQVLVFTKTPACAAMAAICREY